MGVAGMANNGGCVAWVGCWSEGMRASRFVSASLGMWVGVVSWGQVAPPPPGPPPPTPEFVPPPPPPPTPTAPVEIRTPDPDPAFESLVEREADGSLRRIVDMSVEEAALSRNTRIRTEEQRAQVEAYLMERRARLEKVVIENLDLLARIDDGELETIDFANRDETARARAIVEPLYVKPSAVLELKARGVIDDLTARFNTQTIEREYRAALLEEEKRRAGDDNNAQAKVMFRALMRQGYDEAMVTRRRLLLEAADRIETVARGASGELGSALASARSKLAGLSDRDAQYRVMLDTLRSLPIERQRELLRRVIETRGG